MSHESFSWTLYVHDWPKSDFDIFCIPENIDMWGGNDEGCFYAQ